MSEYVSAPVPFVSIGNRRALTDEQLQNDPYLLDFFRAFQHCFERSDVWCVWFFIEAEDA